LRSHIKVAQTFRKHCIGQRSAVCGRNNEGTKPLIGNPNETLDSLLPSNRWANRKDKLGAGIVSEDLYQPQARAMARLVGNGKICI